MLEINNLLFLMYAWKRKENDQNVDNDKTKMNMLEITDLSFLMQVWKREKKKDK